MNLKQQRQAILDQLKNVIDPDLNQDIVTLNFIKSLKIDADQNVSFDLCLTTPACPVKDVLKQQCIDNVKKIDWVNDVNVKLTSNRPVAFGSDMKGLKKVANIIAVSSCKGGVGKSTVAVNLAATLSKTDAKVGLFDADIYGPSLPTMIATEQRGLTMNAEYINPIEAFGMKLMSFGFVEHEENRGSAILRGPMVTQIVNQLLFTTDWGELDYLILDLPPGTGDIQLTICQSVPLTAAVIVTTPQYISFIDVVKGIDMFDTLNVPTVGVIENMSYLIDSTKTILYPFGQGSMDQLVNEFGFKNTMKVPLFPGVAESCDQGYPFVLAEPDHSIAKEYRNFSDLVIREISKIKHGVSNIPKISFDKTHGILVKPADGDSYSVNCKLLRLACQSALNRDEFSNKLLVDPDKIPESIHPLSMNPIGNYAIGINWSDGHSSIFPYETLYDLRTKVVSAKKPNKK